MGARLTKRIDLGVRPAGLAVKTAASQPATLDDHSANGRIGPRQALPKPGQP